MHKVIHAYLAFDQILSHLIELYFFDKWFGEVEGGPEKIHVFQQYITHDTYLMQKVNIAKRIKPDLPERIFKTIAFVNETRNSFAHCAYPELKRKYKDEGIQYRGCDLYTIAGISKLHEDCGYALSHLSYAVFGDRMTELCADA